MLKGVQTGLFGLTSAFILGFCAWAFVDLDGLNAAIGSGFAWSIDWLGYAWQIGLLLTFGIALVIAVTPIAKTKLGGLPGPEFGWFQWSSMILCTLLAGGVSSGQRRADCPLCLSASICVYRQCSQTGCSGTGAVLFALGFLAWSILGSLTTIILMKLHYEKGHPLAPRTLLVPVFGEAVLSNWMGVLADAFCIIAVVAGTVGPIGFLGLQVGYGLEVLFDIPNTVWTQSGVVFGLMALYTVSALTGVSKGIQILSRINIGLGLSLLVYMLFAGPTGFILSGLIEGLLVYGHNFVSMSTYRGYWLAWVVDSILLVFGYGPMISFLTARISRADRFAQSSYDSTGSVGHERVVYHHWRHRAWNGTE